MPSRNALAELVEHLHAFVSGRDRSTERVREMDEQLSRDFSGGEGFPDAQAFAELETATACYKPGGGQFMYDEEQMVLVCRYVLARLGKTSA